MRPQALPLLTWGTATAAISSGLWLSSTDQEAILCSLSARTTGRAIGVDLPLPAAPTAAGVAARPGAGASSHVANPAG